MRLTLHTDYALRLLMVIAAEPDRRHTIAEIAHRYGISRNHLTKVALTLVQAGFVDAQRGRGGGLALARPAAAIRLGDVVRATEEDFALVECFAPATNACTITAACGLRAPLRAAIDAFLAELDRHSLADIIGGPRGARSLSRLLGPATVA